MGADSYRSPNCLILIIRSGRGGSIKPSPTGTACRKIHQSASRLKSAREDCYEKMYERGYFRDSYNDSALLGKFDLSWWDDVTPMLNDKSELTPEKACSFLAMLKDREQLFECNLASEQEPAKVVLSPKVHDTEGVSESGDPVGSAD